MSAVPFARCEAWGRKAAFASQVVDVAMPPDGWLSVSAGLGPRGIGDAAADLLDVAAAVFRAERLLPSRSTANRNVRFALRMPVRDPSAWSGRRGDSVAALLSFLGNAQWEIVFRQRSRTTGEPNWKKGPTSDVQAVALFSGGLDSTCGVGAHLKPNDGSVLSSFTTRQGARQREITADLGRCEPVQWKLKPQAGPGRSFHYRSFLFLSLAAALATSHGTHTLVQFENGILASAIPPVPSLFMTRHAHPWTLRLMENLLRETLGGDWEIANPFAWKTKAECFRHLQQAVGIANAARLAGKTETCWNLYVPHVFGIRSHSGRTKRNGQHCGVCIPCIVRRTALRDDNYAFHLTADRIKNHERLGAQFRSYFQFTSSIDASGSPAAFWRILPSQGRDLLDDGYIKPPELERMWRTFSDEFRNTYLC
jgi:7-cyano-7-deazaguanine synthase in queuosine biosynthesis